MDNGYEQTSALPVKPAPAPPGPSYQPPPATPRLEEIRSEPSSFSYLTILTIFSTVFLSVLYSLSLLISYLVEKLFVSQPTGIDNYGYSPGSDSFLIILAVSTFIVTLPVSAALFYTLRQAEKKQAGRANQKWRRVIYTVVQLVLIISIISSLIGTVYSIFSSSLGLHSSPDYYITGVSDNSGVLSTGGSVVAVVISGMATLMIFALGFMVIMKEDKLKWRQFAQNIFLLFGIIGLIVSVLSIIKVSDGLKEQGSSSPKYEKYEQYSNQFLENRFL